MTDTAVEVRPTSLRYRLPLDDATLARLAAEVAASPHAGKRPSVQWVHGAAIEAQADDDVWVTREQLRSLDDACTKFVTEKFLPNAFARVSLVANVVRVYDRLAQLAKRPYRIVFKGGVMQRLVLLEFWAEMPLEARAIALAHLAKHKAVSISDMDFQILPDARGEDAKHRLLALNYAALLWLQGRFAREIARGESGMLSVTWDRATAREELRTQLQAVVDGLEAAHPLRGATVDAVFVGGTVPTPPRGYVTRHGRAAPAPRRNLYVFACDGKTCVADAHAVFRTMGVRAPRAASSPDLYATCNTYINEGAEKQRPDELRPLFHLARIKHTFVLYYTTKDGHKRCDRLAGELVDLSQGDPGDEGEQDVHAHLTKPYQDYPIVGVAGVALHAYSIPHFLLDHEHMLHRGNVPPWEAPKFGKRVARYVAFLVAHVLGPDVPGTRARKLGALRALEGHARSLAALRAPLRTGVDAVDAFARRERASLVGTGAAGRNYVATLHAHLAALVDAASVPDEPTFDLLFTSHLDDTRRYVRSASEPQACKTRPHTR